LVSSNFAEEHRVSGYAYRRRRTEFFPGSQKKEMSRGKRAWVLCSQKRTVHVLVVCRRTVCVLCLQKKEKNRQNVRIVRTQEEK